VSTAAVLLTLAAIEALVLLAARTRPSLFRVLPALFWIYFLPTVASAVELIPSHHPIYKAAIDHALPASLALLFLSANLPAIARLGPLALGTMALSSAGVFLGGPAAILLFGSALPPGSWSGIGALSASWMGGSINMVAVKASIGTPDAIFAQVVVVDVIVAYAWMALLMALAPRQHWLDRVTRSAAQRPGEAHSDTEQTGTSGWHLLPLVGIVAVSAGGSALSTVVGQVLPVVPGAISSFTWTVVVVTAVGVGLSFTPARRLDRFGASRLGYVLLYFVLACIGAQADLAALRDAPLFIAVGTIWIFLHAVVLLVGGRIFRVPAFLLATASQANIGGPVSAPIVADAYRPGLAGVGLLLAVLGNIYGTYLGIGCALLCKALAT
jgi:uncharacterized membrane protein